MSGKIDLSDFDEEDVGIDISGFDESDPLEPNINISKTESFARGAGQGATLGFQDELSAGLESGVIAPIANKLGLGPDVSYDQALHTNRLQNQDAEEANPWSYGGGKLVGMTPINIAAGGGASIGGQSLAGGATSAINALGESTSRDPWELTKQAGTAGALGTLFGFGGNLAIKGGAKVAGKTYDAAKPIAKRVFSKIRGIAPETVELYSNKLTRDLVDRVAQGSDTLEQGILETSEGVAQNLTQKRANFVEARLAAIDNEILKAHAENKPVSISGILSKISEEKSKLLSVTDTDVAIKGKLETIEARLRNLADQNIKDLPAEELIREVNPEASAYRGRFVQGGETAAPHISPTAKNSMASQGNDFSYLPESVSILPKSPGGPKDLSMALSQQAGSVKSVDPIMGPRRNISGENMNFTNNKTGKRISSAIDNDLSVIDVEKVGVDPFLTASQTNQLRRGFNRESQAAFTSPAGKPLPGAESMKALGDVSREGLDTISPNIRAENQKLAELFEYENALRRGGLTEQEVDPVKLREFLTAGPKRSATETAPAQALDEMLGTDLIEQRKIVRAAKELNPQTWYNKVATGGSLLPIAAATSAIPFIGPAAAGAIGLAGTIAQAPILTKPIIRGAVKFDDMIRYVRTNPSIQKYLEPLMTATKRGAASMAATQFTLMSQHPELRETVRQMKEAEEE